MPLNCECRIPGYHGDADWVPVAGAHDTEDAVLKFARKMDAKDFELWLREDEPRDVWVRKVGSAQHLVYSVTFQTVKQFTCHMQSTET